MPLQFPCEQCRQPIVVSFLRPGDRALCRACGSHTAVPGDAIETTGPPSYNMPSATVPGAPAPYAPSGPGSPQAVEPREGDCLNHPGTAAVGFCSMCAESFCRACLDAVGPAARCRPCLLGTIASATPMAGTPLSMIPQAPCKTANDALTMSIIGIFCFGIILEPLALYRGLKARREIRESPFPMSGDGKATAAIIISSIVLSLNVLVFVLPLLLGFLVGLTRR